MIKWLIAALLLLPAAAWAQNQGQIVPSGAFTPGHTVRAQNSTGTVAVDGGGSAGATKSGQGYLTEIGITNTGTPFCITDTLINTVGGYHQFCLGANALGGGLISYNAIGGASPLGLNFNINGSTFAFPGAGTGNVVGPTSPVPTANDIVIWNGGLTIADSHIATSAGTLTANAGLTSAIAPTGSTIAGLTSNSVSADTILSYVFCTASCTPLPASGAGNYDGVRGVGISNAGSTVPIVAGVSGYVLANQAFSGSGPSSVALFGTGAVNADGGSVWGLNTNVSDHAYRVAQVGSASRRVTGAELDVSSSYADTNLTGLLIAGNSVIQPTNSTAIAVVGQDFSAVTPGSIAKWSQAIFTFNGTSNLFALVGSYCASNSGTQTCDSQGMQWGAYVGGGGGVGEFQFGPGTGGAFPCLTCNHATFQFQINWGLNIGSGGLTSRASTDQVLRATGHLTLPAGVLLKSSNDADNTLEPIEVLSSSLLLNAAIQVNNGGTPTNAVSCSGSPTGSFAAINGIITHC